MTNADYYVNVYRHGGTGDCYRDKAMVDWLASKMAVGHRIGVWHVRLKEGKR